MASIDREGYEKMPVDSIWACPVLGGSSLLFVDQRPDRVGVWIAPFANGKLEARASARQLLKTLPLASRIALKANEMFYVADGTRELRRVSLRDGIDRPVGMKLPGLLFGFDVRSDGKEIVYTDLYSKIRFVVIDNVFK
jgi:hypothetical protein